MISLEPFRHFLVRCPCGHDDHVTREGYLATNDADLRREGGAVVRVVTCYACEAIEGGLSAANGADVRITFVSAQRVERTGIAEGQPATVARQSYRIVSVEEVTKLDGNVPTGVCRVALRRAW